MPTVEVPGLGNVEFPDGTPPATMTAAIKKALAAQSAPEPMRPLASAGGALDAYGALTGGVKETLVPGAEYSRSASPLTGMGDAAGRVAGSLKDAVMSRVNTLGTPRGAFNAATTLGIPGMPGMLDIKDMLAGVSAQADPLAQKAVAASDAGNPVGAAGYGLAAGIPGLGPAAAAAGERLGAAPSDPEAGWRGAGNAVGLLAPFLLGAGAKSKGGATGRAAGGAAEGYAEYKDPVTGKVSYRAPGWTPEADAARKAETTRLQDYKTTLNAEPPAGSGPDPKTAIPLSVAERGSSPVLRQVQSGIEGTWLGKKGFQPLREAQKAAIETRANETVAYIKAVRGTANDVGNAVSEAWKAGTGEAKKIGGKMFETIDDMVGNKVEEVQVPTKTISSVLGPDGKSLMTDGFETKSVRTSNVNVSPDALRKFGAEIQKDLSMSNIRVSDAAHSNVKRLLEDISNLPEEMSFGDFHRTRQEIGELARNISSQMGPDAIPSRTKGLLLKFDDLADKALMEAARKVPGLAQKVEAANAHWRWLKKATNDSMISAALNTKDPSTIARTLANISVDEVATAKKLMDERTIQAVKAQNATEWIEKAITDPQGAPTALSGQALKGSLRGMDAEKLAAWHTPKEIEQLKYLAENVALAQSVPAARTGLIPNLALVLPAGVPLHSAARILSMQGDAGFNAIKSYIRAARSGSTTQKLFWGARIMDMKRKADAKFGPDDSAREGDAGTR